MFGSKTLNSLTNYQDDLHTPEKRAFLGLTLGILWLDRDGLRDALRSARITNVSCSKPPKP